MSVTYFRTFILVLLAVLLPIRGAVAAAMLCPGGAQTSSAVVMAEHGHHDMNAGPYRDPHETATHAHHHGHASADSSSDKHASACQFCAGGCCVTPLAFAPPSVESPLVTTLAAFPAFTARVSAHGPDGQDRPPRTI